jgi:hypothetical protein
MAMKRITTCLVCCCALVTLVARAADTAAEPTGIYKTIDVRLLNDTVKALRTSQGPAQQNVIDNIIARPEEFAPPVLYVLSSVLFEQGKKDEAVFWIYAAQLRGLIDANICTDRSAARMIFAMNGRYSPPIIQYCGTNMPLLTNTIRRALAWEEKTPCHYDRRWINLHGTDALTGNTNSPLSAPLDQWETIRQRTRDEFLNEFNRRSH